MIASGFEMRSRYSCATKPIPADVLGVCRRPCTVSRPMEPAASGGREQRRQPKPLGPNSFRPADQSIRVSRQSRYTRTGSGQKLLRPPVTEVAHDTRMLLATLSMRTHEAGSFALNANK